jgi:hypothetical protein
LPELHARLLADVLALGSSFPLVLTGLLSQSGPGPRHRSRRTDGRDHAVAAHRPRGTGLAGVGDRVASLSARFQVTDPHTGDVCEVEVLKEVFWRPVVHSDYGPVLGDQDGIGPKARALAARDLIDVFVASRRWNSCDLEEFGRRHARGRFSPEDLQARLAGAGWIDDAEFAAYGLDERAMGMGPALVRRILHAARTVPRTTTEGPLAACMRVANAFQAFTLRTHS